MKEEMYLIESMEHTHGDFKVWWAPKSLGYTQDVNLAGRYPLGAASGICARAGSKNERMWKESEVLKGEAGPALLVVRAY